MRTSKDQFEVMISFMENHPNLLSASSTFGRSSVTEAATKKVELKALETEEAAMKRKAAAVNVEFTNICDLNDDVMLNILSFLDMQDKIAFALTCERFRRISEDGRVFRRVDLSRRPILRVQRGAINELFGNTQVAQHITELNISNVRIFNWQMNKQLEGFIISICPHLESLHVINCGMSLRGLHRMLQNAPRLTSLSWSVWDITSEDIEFVFRSIKSRSTQISSTNSLLFTRNLMSSDVKSSNGICLKSIKHLHLEMYRSISHIQILEYLVLSCCKDIEELQIYTWLVDEDYYKGHTIPLQAHETIPCFPEQFTFISDVLLPLHSLTVISGGSESYSYSRPHYIFREKLRNFILSVVRRKSRETKWRKLWMPPVEGFSRLQNQMKMQDLFPLTDPHELQSVEEITAHAGPLPDTMDDLKTLFQRIGDKTVRKLCLRQTESDDNLIRDLWQPISRVGGHVLKFLSLSFGTLYEIDAETNDVLHTLFSNCLNITELDLLYCHFEKDICKPLSKLRHLTKVQLHECAVSSKYNGNFVKISNPSLLTFVENSKNITHLDVRGCPYLYGHFSCCLTDGHLQALAKLRNLESLTLCNISGFRKGTFLQNISENCKFLTMLRIDDEFFNNSRFPILIQSAKFLKHLALNVRKLDLQLEDFWNLLRYAQNLERLCIRTGCYDYGLINVRVAVETVKSLSQLLLLHLHSCHKENVEVFHNQIQRMLEEENSNRSCFFELVVDCLPSRSLERKKQLIFKKALPMNKFELCDMTPIVEIPRF